LKEKMNQALHEALQQYQLPAEDSHKGQNGKLLLIGGSDLFHAASKWSLDVASKIVDMVFYASVPSNNELIAQAKLEFWNGIVLPRGELESYVAEADCILIGPGMERRPITPEDALVSDWSRPLTEHEWQTDTQRVVNYLLTRYPHKRWVIDAGALQMVDPLLLNKNCIISPHPAELRRVLSHPHFSQDASTLEAVAGAAELGDTALQELLAPLLENGVVVLLKGKVDRIFANEQSMQVAGGNAGMTKGGTGDVLAGLVAALYCTTDAKTAAVLGSYVNKQAAEALAESVGPFFNASELAAQVPKTLWSLLSQK
jgi:hydroxyethylthiazole kinase-like uncharacterized protein yjeF